MGTQTETLPIGQAVRVNAKWTGRIEGRFYGPDGETISAYGIRRIRKDGTDSKRPYIVSPVDVRPVLSLQVVRKPEYYCGEQTGRIYFTCETVSGTPYDGTGAVLGRGSSEPSAVADFLFRAGLDGICLERAQLSVTRRVIESADGLRSRVDAF